MDTLPLGWLQWFKQPDLFNGGLEWLWLTARTGAVLAEMTAGRNAAPLTQGMTRHRSRRNPKQPAGRKRLLTPGSHPVRRVFTVMTRINGRSPVEALSRSQVAAGPGSRQAKQGVAKLGVFRMISPADES
ncbi:hypothetical protein QF038_002189 [Pseudarthrobacter sp. W1I19]|nr:hypothetical protein [Pseudarthrobacter sp. W1I19]